MSMNMSLGELAPSVYLQTQQIQILAHVQHTIFVVLQVDVQTASEVFVSFSIYSLPVMNQHAML